MTLFLAFQNTYTHVQIAVYQDTAQLGFVEIDKLQASKECIRALQDLLAIAKVSLFDISFIAVNQGPGPFSTLRVVISTVNGISFATRLPLIGVNGIQALLYEYAHTAYKNKIVILNAFGQDLYYGIQMGNSLEFGCKAGQTLLGEIAQKIPDNPILFLGNGIDHYKDTIQDTFGARAQFLDPNPSTASLHSIALLALTRWQKQEDMSYHVQPLYFKSAFVQVK